MPHLRHFSTLFSLALITSILLARAADTQPATRPFKLLLAPDTTLITSPLHPDGTPDYLTALNTELSQNITPQNNAAIPLLRIFGPAMINSEKCRPLILKAFNLELPADGHYFLDPATYARQQSAVGNPINLAAFSENESTLTKTPWQAEKFPAYADWLKTKRKTSRTSHSRQPPPPSLFPPDAALAVLPTRLRMAATALSARAMLCLAANDIPNARADLLTIHRLARLERQRPFIINTLVAISVDAFAFHAEQTLLRSGKLSPNDVRSLLSDLQSLPEINSIPTNTDRAEHFYALDTLFPAVRGDPNKTLTPYLQWSGPDLLTPPRRPRPITSTRLTGTSPSAPSFIATTPLTPP